MHIGIDCRFGGTFSGLGSYTRALVTHLLRRSDPLQYTLFVRSTEEAWLRELVESSTNYRLQTTDFSHYSFSEQIFFPALLKKSGIDLLFSLHFNVPLICPVPFVATIHDLILHRYPNEAPLWKRMAYRSVMHHTVTHACALIAVSPFVSRELRETYGEHVARKTTIIPEGVDARFSRRPDREQEDVLLKYNIRKPFFLYIGNAKEHKNVRMLIAAFKNLHAFEKTLVLVTSGREADLLESGQGIRRLSSLPEEDFPALYSAAEAFVTASLYEGFCLPIAEARACGCPIIALNIGVMPEVLGEDGVLVEATAEALTWALRSPPPPSRGGRRLWERVAEETAQRFLMARS
ncbi:glycosyltransferase family 4 protein [Candidatus Peregrinibacteria bacterium]|nr:glycosyltransferase family 4 protein [Candidatus Peregrinibacteria bacterium]